MATQQQTDTEVISMQAADDDASDHPHGATTGTETLQAGVGEAPTPHNKPGGRFLVIRVSQGKVSKANIRIPLGLARTAMKFIPRAEREHLKEQGVDVEELLVGLTGDEHGMLAQVEADDGTSVWIGVE